MNNTLKGYAKPPQSTVYTYTDPKYLDRRVITEDHLRFYAENCRKLARFMKALPDHEHDQSQWAHMNIHDRACGTPACALGWAAYSGEFPGFQFGVNGVTGQHQVVGPVINGGRVGPLSHGRNDSAEDEAERAASAWLLAGPYFFGMAVQHDVFNRGDLRKGQVVRKLRAWAATYDTRAKVGVLFDTEYTPV